jgi:hypothetical protein
MSGRAVQLEYLPRGARFFHVPQAIDERHVTVGDPGPHAADRLAGSPGLAGGRAQSYWSGQPTLFELKAQRLPGMTAVTADPSLGS